MRKRGLLLLASFGAAAVIAIPASVMAVTNGGVGGRPAYPKPNNPRTDSIFIYQLKSGQQASDGVKVLNNTNQQQTISLAAVDSVLSSGGAFACAQNSEPKNDVGAWIKLQSNTVTLAANSNQIVPFTITVPQGASVGEHDGCITIQAASQTATPSGKNGVLLSFRSAIRVAVTIPGKIVKKLTIQSVNVSRAKDGNYLVTPVIRNNGNVSLDTNLQISLAPVFGIGSVTISGGSLPILPHTTASSSFEVKRPYWGGFFNANVAATYSSNPSVGLGISQNSHPETVSKTSGVFFINPKPLAWVIIVLVILIILLIIAWFIRQLMHRQRVRTQWVEYTAKRGDTLQKIAAKHNISWKRLAAANRIKPPYEIKQKQTLKVPKARE